MDIYLIISFLLFNSVILLLLKNINDFTKFQLIFVNLVLENQTNPYFNNSHQIESYDVNKNTRIDKDYYNFILNYKLYKNDNICIIVKNNFIKNHLKHKLRKILNKKIYIISIENFTKLILTPKLFNKEINYQSILEYFNIKTNKFQLINIYNNLVNILFQNNYYNNKIKDITKTFNIKDNKNNNLYYYPILLKFILKY